ncbi:hypothetical protein PIB30_087775 [Stylosanthes scabra]|uniref:Uncharacterized protein n=1 Tax=Stylosanthes scabra TaxID=79078 RepID=A0ABU6XW18_9FABA|nr:hypothetical protein [Stylosanthes scabra]
MKQHGIDTQGGNPHQITSKRGSGVIQGPIHARTAFRPRLGVGFHHSPRLGVAGKPRARQNQVAACSRRQQQPHDRVTTTFERGLNVKLSP